MKRKIIAFFIGTAFFVGAIGFGINTNSKFLISSIEVLAAPEDPENHEKICLMWDDTYCEYADHTPSNGPAAWRVLGDLDDLLL